MADETVKEWLNTLKVGSRVVVKTQIRSYDGVVEHIEDDKIWVIYSLDQHATGAVSVNLNTGTSPEHRMLILPFID